MVKSGKKEKQQKTDERVDANEKCVQMNGDITSNGLKSNSATTNGNGTDSLASTVRSRNTTFSTMTLTSRTSKDCGFYRLMDNPKSQSDCRICFCVDPARRNIGVAGRSGAGKSALINALRGLSYGDLHAAGRYPSEKMEPFAFIENDLQDSLLWEIPYPRLLNSVLEVYDRSVAFDRLYENCKLELFDLIFVVLADGTICDDDLAFMRCLYGHKAPFTLVSTKTDEQLDAESRESRQEICNRLKQRYVERATDAVQKMIQKKAQYLEDIELLHVSAPVVRDILNGNTDYLHYKLDENRILELTALKPGCHYALENQLRKQPMDARRLPEMTLSRPIALLAETGFEIVFDTDDRFADAAPTGALPWKTTFNYGFAGSSESGKSALINAIRGLTARHPLAAGRMRAHSSHCERYDFDDPDSSATLWEIHYPKRICSYFEFIDAFRLPEFTAIFILVDTQPTDEDFIFAKIASRRNATIVFLLSKCDRHLMARSRSDEIPVCDLLIQRFIDKGMARFDNLLASNAPELCGRVHLFFVSAPVFYALKVGEIGPRLFLLHERAVFDFLKQKRMIAEMLDSPMTMKTAEEAISFTDKNSLTAPQSACIKF